MDKRMKAIKNLFRSTNLSDKEITLLTMFVHTLKIHQIDAVLAVLWQLSWDERLLEE